MGFLDTLSKAKAYENMSKQTAAENEAVANHAKQMYMQEQQAMAQAEEARKLGLAHQLGKREMADDLAASQLGTVSVIKDPRFTAPVMRDAMVPQGLANQAYTNQYNGVR